MATEKFSLEQFKAALPEGSIDTGIFRGEHVFRVPVDDKTVILVRSSIGDSGYADNTGEDSIRITLVDSFDLRTIAPKIDAYTTRVAGWEQRMNLKINMLKDYRKQSGNCPKCGDPLRIGRGSRPGKFFGKLFASCSDWSHNSFVALREYDEKEPQVGQTSSDKISIPVHPIAKELNLDRANAFQRQVIESKGKGIINICAGAGSGKTYVLEQTIASMLISGVDPSRILAVTFSVKAAQEMRGRIAKTIWPDLTPEEFTFFSEGISKVPENYDFSRNWIDQDPIRKFLDNWVCTIHACCFRLLKSFGEKIRVPDTKEEWAINDIFKDSLAEFHWEESPDTVKTVIGRAINDLIEPYNSKPYFEKMLSGQDIPEEVPSWLTEIFRRYIRFMDKGNLVDFNMMQARVRKYLRENKNFRESVQGMFDYVLIDEAQDTDSHQCEILWTIAEKAANIFFVGDTRQSLYRWRGAEPEVMENKFDDHWKNVKRLSLPINYRSTQTIVVQSNKMIKLNYLGERAKYLFEAMARDDAEVGDPLQYYEYDKINELGDDLARIIIETESPGDWFVLSRTRAECAAIHLQLIRNKVPAINLSGGLLFGAPHIQKVLAYAQLAVNWNHARDNIEILTTVANVASDTYLSPMTRRRHIETCTHKEDYVECGCPIIIEEGQDISHVRFYGKKHIEEARNWDGVCNQQSQTRTNRGGNLYFTVAARAARDFVDFVNKVEKHRDDAKEALEFIIDHSVLPWLAHDKGISQADLGENGEAEDFDVLLSLVEPGNNLEQFLAIVDDLSKGGATGDKESVQLMTIHKSKGAERKFVALNLTRLPIVPPKPKKKAIVVSLPPRIEDERNCAYVGITRAKQRCILVASRDWNGMPVQRSPFLNEMDVVMPRDIITDNPDIVGQNGTEVEQ